MRALDARGLAGLLAGYYFSTPLFAVADLALGAPVRVAGLERPAHRVAYYVVLLGPGGLCRARPSAAPWVGMLESAANLTLLLLAILLPVWTAPEAVLAGGVPEDPFGRVPLVNALLSGTVLVVTFYRHQAAMRVRPPVLGA